ncbi:MAG TPA: biosynthetic peptidoglycan transglycosylase [Burkholderiaceae bacterium]|nr:biosynthetic peptidoglycan transglycosylase [Burkholderiaceae bacterium]
MTPRRAALALGLAGLLLLVGLVGAVCVAVLSNGVLATAPSAWTTELRVAGHSVKANVSGLLRLATAPGVAHVLDGQSIATPTGRIAFRRDGAALVALCAPCRWQHDALAAGPWTPRTVELRLERSGAELIGWLAVEGVRIDYTAELAGDGVVVRWQLPRTGLRRAYAALASVIPEASLASIEGSLEARGTLRLPQRTGSMQFHLDGAAVGGLGTEVLQFGSFAMSCRDGEGQALRVVNGDSERRWIALDRMGLLPAAVVAAEDQRFERHAGYDATQLAPLLASFDLDGPRRGASTLTQQLARTLFTGGERTLARKLRELLYAIEMERTLGKARILELYLNTVDWGPGICGARYAARTYFRKRPDQLTPLEAAWLAGILRAPHAAHGQQWIGGAAETDRARWVLLQMRGLPRSERERWSRRALVLAPAPARAIERSAPRRPDRNAPVAERALKATEPAGDGSGAVRTVAVVR